MEIEKFNKASHYRELIEWIDYLLRSVNIKKDECIGVINGVIISSNAFLKDKDGVQKLIKEKSFEIVQGLIKLREDYEEQFREL